MHPSLITPKEFINALTSKGESVTQAITTLSHAACVSTSTAWRLHRGCTPATTTLLLLTIWQNHPKLRQYWPTSNNKTTPQQP